MSLFDIGKEYHRRSEIHGLVKGQQQGGISTPKEHPIILAFTTPQGSKHGYHDRWVDGMFYYAGEGQQGNMNFTSSNRQIRDHKQLKKQVLVFEETRKAHHRFIGYGEYIDHHSEVQADKDGLKRDVIVFHLNMHNEPVAFEEEEIQELDLSHLKPKIRDTLSSLREKAKQSTVSQYPISTVETILRYRSEAVKNYALKRANGICEKCNSDAPFIAKKGPYLEVHHITRLSDEGPDSPENVVSLCPNCHREAHYSIDKEKLKTALLQLVKQKETTLI